MDTTLYINLVAAIANSAIVLLTYLQIKNHSALFSKEQSLLTEFRKSEILTDCLSLYFKIQKGRLEAECSTVNKAEKSRLYYRELIDLFWLEYHLWLDGLIPDEIMKSWLYARQQSNSNDEIKGPEATIKYSKVWEELKQSHYFRKEPGLPFTSFMDMVHEGNHMEAMEKAKNAFKLLKKEALAK